jgi:hypothetical protein
MSASKRVENDEFRAAIARMIRAYGERVADADDFDLGEMVTLRDDLERAINAAITGQRATYGYSWSVIGNALGITRQAAQQRYGAS